MQTQSFGIRTCCAACLSQLAKPVQEVQHTMRMMAKAVMSHPIAAAQRIVELCRTFDNMGDVFVAFTASVPLVVKEVILTECLRVCLLRNDKTLRPEQEHIAVVNHGNVCSFLGKFTAANEALDLYAVFLYVAQGMRAQEHPSDVGIIESVFQHSMGAPPARVRLSAARARAGASALQCAYCKYGWAWARELALPSMRIVNVQSC
jgi:hypothetical protein